MAGLERSPGSAWVRIAGGAIIALVLAALLYAVSIGIANFSRIGV